MDLTLDALKTFAAVVETGGFTRAAERLHRSQAAVSMRVKALEAELGPLLDRASMRLTPRGEEVLAYARRLVALHRETVEALTRPEAEGLVRLGLPEDVAASRLGPLLAELAAAHPRLRAEVLCAPSPDLRAAFAGGRLDVAVTTAADGDPAPAPLCGVTPELLERPALGWLCPVGLDPAADPLPLAVFHEGCAYRRMTLGALAEAGRACRVVLESPSLAAIISVVRAGLAVAPVLADTTCESGCRVLNARGRRRAGLPALPAASLWLWRGEGLAARAVAGLL